MTVSFFRFTKLNWTIVTNDPSISESKKKERNSPDETETPLLNVPFFPLL